MKMENALKKLQENTDDNCYIIFDDFSILYGVF